MKGCNIYWNPMPEALGACSFTKYWLFWRFFQGFETANFYEIVCRITFFKTPSAFMLHWKLHYHRGVNNHWLDLFLTLRKKFSLSFVLQETPDTSVAPSKKYLTNLFFITSTIILDHLLDLHCLGSSETRSSEYSVAFAYLETAEYQSCCCCCEATNNACNMTLFMFFCKSQFIFKTCAKSFPCKKICKEKVETLYYFGEVLLPENFVRKLIKIICACSVKH